jgi:[protein-PII] uridylyltransferase
VQLFPNEGGDTWRLEIVATDRPGMLAQIAEVFVKSEISVQTAQVMTLGDRVEDVLVISGECLRQPRTQRQFERALLDVLTEPTQHAA